jgi:glycosyltransferase involved in cell wall biosynthesis
MRVVFATRERAMVGGLETYVRGAMTALGAARVDVALLAESDAPRERDTIDAGIRGPVWCVSEAGASSALASVRNWRPDVIYVHGLESPALADDLIETAPTVYFAHGYHGVCISGEKMHKRPVAVPCNRHFGWQCLLQFYPRRCGGLNPLTMWRDFSREANEHERLARYAAIVTGSEHMRSEYARAVPLERVHRIPMLVRKTSIARSQAPGLEESRRRLLFAGRMTELKGGQVFLDAIPEVARALAVPIEVTMMGDGPSRASWQNRATRIEARGNGVSIRFPGWLSNTHLAREIVSTDLLVVPSLWPEPFGTIGVEAARLGIPSAAFDVGGISEWLLDGVNGVLAPADPPTASGLASAIVKCVGDEGTYARLSRGALESASRFDADAHIAALLELFRRVSLDVENPRTQTA